MYTIRPTGTELSITVLYWKMSFCVRDGAMYMYVQIPSSALRPLVNLESLSLRHNRIRRLSRRAFNTSRSLQTLDLSHNRIRKISRRSFHGLQSVRKIDLRHNRLVILDQQTFTSLQHNTAAQVEVFVAENPWLCNCIFGYTAYYTVAYYTNCG